MKRQPLIALLVSSALATPCIAAPITFNTALPISKNELVIRNQLIVARQSNSNTSQTTSSLTSTLVYGATSKLTLFATLPVADRVLKTPEARFSNSGFGDIQLIARYTAYQKNSAGKTVRLAPFIGSKLASGNEDRANSPSIPLGSGSSAFSAGLIATYATTDWTFDSQFAYQENGRSNNIEFGDSFSFDASLQYRLIPTQLSITSSAYLNGVIELNVADQKRNTNNGIRNDDSGGTTIFIAPGLQYITQRWIIESSIQIPVKTNDILLENDYIARIGIRTNY